MALRAVPRCTEGMDTFVLAGFGFRGAAWQRVAAALPGVECVGAVTRRAEAPVPAFRDLDECVRRTRPDFVVTALPPDGNPAAVATAVALGLPVLSETPPGPGSSALVQVAEQYPLMPAHAARIAAVATGVIGTPTQVQVSSTQQHHAMALIRRLLGAGHAAATVRATRTVAPLVQPLDRAGWTGDEQPRPAATTLATLDFGDGRSGVYDFTTGQTRNLLRFRRLLVRGTHGELQDDDIVHLPAARTIARTRLSRWQSGHDLDLNGYDTQSIAMGERVVYRNPYTGLRFNDDEIAMATLLEAMAAWVRDAGPPPYPLAEGQRDQALAAAVERAAETGTAVTVP